MAIQRRLVSCGVGLLAITFMVGFGAESSQVDELGDQAVSVADPSRLSDWHDLLGSEPHVAGTPGDQREIERLAAAFEAMGLDTEVREFKAYLPQPVKAEVEILGGRSLAVDEKDSRPRGVIRLPLTERNLLEDPSSRHPGLSYGWNAFSGSGEVTAEVVYANYGTREDFDRLDELGIDLNGKIVLARYGRNYRGYKVKFAQEAGAVGLLMYLDPADYGYTRGETWPKGGWANPTCIQRGSVLVLPYKGDPLTPFVEATEDADRLDPAHVGFPWIPVQPIGYAAASMILARMQGAEVEDEAWQGGLPMPYRIEGGPELKLRLMVEQDRELRTSANVLARIEGARHPEQIVVVGCHHDAWGFGAADPLAGTIVLMEAARAFADAADRGFRPDRTIIFAAWGAEEFGIIGSTEWVEGNASTLREQCVAYVNLDMAAMGPNFGSSATPVLRKAVEEAVASVPQAGSDEDLTLADTWAGGPDGPSFGDLGGGSDHVGFVCHVGVPAIRLSAGGAPGVAYHSNYDTLAWYRSTVGDDYEPALMVTRACIRVLAKLANESLPPYEWVTVVEEVRRHALRHLDAARASGMQADLAGLDQACMRLESSARSLEASMHAHDGELEPAVRRELGEAIMAAERVWLDEGGLPGRPWYRNTYISDDPQSGYSASPLPELHAAQRAGDSDAFNAAVAACAIRVDALSDRLGAINKSLN